MAVFHPVWINGKMDMYRAVYRSLLLKLSDSFTSLDLKKMKFICRDVIPDGRAELITEPFELFIALEQRNLLSVEKLDFLASKLEDIDRNDLRKKLLEIQGKNNALSLFNEVFSV